MIIPDDLFSRSKSWQTKLAVLLGFLGAKLRCYLKWERYYHVHIFHFPSKTPLSIALGIIGPKWPYDVFKREACRIGHFNIWDVQILNFQRIDKFSYDLICLSNLESNRLREVSQLKPSHKERENEKKRDIIASGFIDYVRPLKPLIAAFLDKAIHIQIPIGSADGVLKIIFSTEDSYYFEQLKSTLYRDQLLLLSDQYFGVSLHLELEIQRVQSA